MTVEPQLNNEIAWLMEVRVSYQYSDVKMHIVHISRSAVHPGLNYEHQKPIMNSEHNSRFCLTSKMKDWYAKRQFSHIHKMLYGANTIPATYSLLVRLTLSYRCISTET